MLLTLPNTQYIASVAHEGKIFAAGIDAVGAIWYTIKQDGFEDSFLNHPEQKPLGWENWEQVVFPDEPDDASVVLRQAEVLTFQSDPGQYLLRSCYRSRHRTEVAPITLVSALGHIYLFRQSKEGTVLVDRFVLDGMTNRLKRKLEVRFKRSRQKHQPIDSMKMGAKGISDVDSMDFRDSAGEFFYEPTTELFFLKGVTDGVAVVLMPTTEHEQFRWHFFHRYQGEIVMTSVRCSSEGLFDLNDYDFMEPSAENPALLSPHRIEGILTRHVGLKLGNEELDVTKNVAAAKYDLQIEKKTDSGLRLIKDATRLMVVAPTDKGTATLSFAVAKDGTLSALDGPPPVTRPVRTFERDVLLPPDTLERVERYVPVSPKPEGAITAMKRAGENGRLVITAAGPVAPGALNRGDTVRLKNLSQLDGHYRVTGNGGDSVTLHPSTSHTKEMGSWEKVVKAPDVLRPGAITSLTMENGGLILKAFGLPQQLKNHHQELQLAGTPTLDGSWKVVSVHGQEITLDRPWEGGSALDPVEEIQKRRSIQFDGTQYCGVVIPALGLSEPSDSRSFYQTYSAWIYLDSPAAEAVIMAELSGLMQFFLTGGKVALSVRLSDGSDLTVVTDDEAPLGQWVHYTGVVTGRVSGRRRQRYGNSSSFSTTAEIFQNGDSKKSATRDGLRPGWPTQQRETPSQDSAVMDAGILLAHCLAGRMCEAQVWEEARTAQQIKGSMYLQLSGREPGLAGYWRLGAIVEGRERKVADFSDRRHDGTVYGDSFVHVSTPILDYSPTAEYRNEEFVAVTQHATYRESVEVRFESVLSGPGALTSLQFTYWGKKNRSSDDSNPWSVSATVAPPGPDGWQRVEGNFLVPSGISLLRSFGMSEMLGGEEPGHVKFRNHHLTLISESISAATVTHQVSLTPLQAPGAKPLSEQLAETQKERGKLLLERWSIQDQLSDVDARHREALMKQLENEFASLSSQLSSARGYYDSVRQDLNHHWFRIKNHEQPWYIQNRSRQLTGVAQYGTLWELVDDGGCFRFRNEDGTVLDTFQGGDFVHSADWNDGKARDDQRWTLDHARIWSVGDGGYLTYDYGEQDLEVVGWSDSAAQLWYYELAREKGPVTDARNRVESLQREHDRVQKELEVLRAKGRLDRNALNQRLNDLDSQLGQLEVRLRKENEQARTQSPSQQPLRLPDLLAHSDIALKTTGGLLEFVQPASRITAIETCEGNVQLSYIDEKNRLRFCDYDATADQRNSTFEQWTPPGDGCCLEFGSRSAPAAAPFEGIKLANPISLRTDQWSVEAWFCYPLAADSKNDRTNYNVLVAGGNGEQPPLLARTYTAPSGQRRQELGAWLDPRFVSHDGGFTAFYDMEGLSAGWHHVAVVGRGQERVFYLDGERIPAPLFTYTLTREEVWNALPADLRAPIGLQQAKNTLSFRLSQEVHDVKSRKLKVPLPKVLAEAPDLLQTEKARDKAGETIEISLPSRSLPSSAPEKWSICQIGNGEVSNPADGIADQLGPYKLREHQFALVIKVRFSDTCSAQFSLIPVNGRLVKVFKFAAGTFTCIAPSGHFTSNQKQLADGREHRILLIGNKTGSDDGSMDLFVDGVKDQTAPCSIESGEYKITAERIGPEIVSLSYWDRAIDGEDLEKLKRGEEEGVNGQIRLLPNVSSAPFGQLAEVRVWEVALSDQEIAIQSKTKLTGNEPGLAGYYPMNEGQGTTVRNVQGNASLNGTIDSAERWFFAGPPIGALDTATSQAAADVKPSTVCGFDGSSRVQCRVDDRGNLGANFTIELWLNAREIHGEHESYLLSKWGHGGGYYLMLDRGTLVFNCSTGRVRGAVRANEWHHVAVSYNGKTLRLYLNGDEKEATLCTGSATPNAVELAMGSSFNGQLAELRLWKTSRSSADIRKWMNCRIPAGSPGLAGHWPLDGVMGNDGQPYVTESVGNLPQLVTNLVAEAGGSLTFKPAPRLPPDALITGEYSTFGLDSKTGKRSAMMRRFLAWTEPGGVTLLTGKRIEDLELAWIGNAQFEPTLLGYIEGAPPVPSENLTLQDDYNGATSVELRQAEDVEFSWNRAQDAGLGAAVDIFAGIETEADAGIAISTKIAATRAGLKGNYDFSYQFQNESNIASSSQNNMADRLELHGTLEEDAKFPKLGKRFIPKNVGYALVVSSLADVFVSRLARTQRMVGYQVLPVPDIPPDVNTITFLINPAYTMNGSLDGQTGSGAASDRFYKHVPETRAQFGSLYPASYYRLKEAYDLKCQIQEEDKRRQSYFEQFNSRLLDEISLNREVGKGPAAKAIEVNDAGDAGGKKLSKEEQEAHDKAEQERIQKEGKERQKEQKKAVDAKRKLIESKIADLEQRAHATQCFANWQKKMEDLQIRAGKRNIVNSYIWDGDGGLHSEAQSFADSAAHTIGGSFNLNAGLGAEGKFGVTGVAVELTAQATVNMTQTMSKSETRSKTLELSVDLSGVECRGITDYNDLPLIPGEKVDRYRFMTFYLEGSVHHFHDFFNQVVDPEWLASNDEEARALRQTMAGKPNKAWRVLHRVTYVERPALMGFGRSLSTPPDAADDIREIRQKLEQLNDQVMELTRMLKQLSKT